MAKKPEDNSKELAQFRQYLSSELNEDAKRHLIHPLFNKLYK